MHEHHRNLLACAFMMVTSAWWHPYLHARDRGLTRRRKLELQHQQLAGSSCWPAVVICTTPTRGVAIDSLRCALLAPAGSCTSDNSCCIRDLQPSSPRPFSARPAVAACRRRLLANVSSPAHYSLLLEDLSPPSAFSSSADSPPPSTVVVVVPPQPTGILHTLIVVSAPAESRRTLLLAVLSSAAPAIDKSPEPFQTAISAGHKSILGGIVWPTSVDRTLLKKEKANGRDECAEVSGGHPGWEAQGRWGTIK